MPYMEWEPGFNFNIEEIDRQHRKLVDIINLLYEALHPSSEKGELHALVESLNKEATAINEMLDYTVKHFQYEEQLLQAAKYPAYYKHKQQHDAFTNRVQAYKKLFDISADIDITEMMDYLKGWLRNHILGEDRKYVPYLKG